MKTVVGAVNMSRPVGIPSVENAAVSLSENVPAVESK
jgi:hypothetical protein